MDTPQRFQSNCENQVTSNYVSELQSVSLRYTTHCTWLHRLSEVPHMWFWYFWSPHWSDGQDHMFLAQAPVDCIANYPPHMEQTMECRSTGCRLCCSHPHAQQSRHHLMVMMMMINDDDDDDNDDDDDDKWWWWWWWWWKVDELMMVMVMMLMDHTHHDSPWNGVLLTLTVTK